MLFKRVDITFVVNAILTTEATKKKHKVHGGKDIIKGADGNFNNIVAVNER